MSRHFLEIPFTRLLADALSSEAPAVQTLVDESELQKYDIELLCILPEPLRGLKELQTKLCKLGEELETEVSSHLKESDSYNKTLMHLDMLQRHVNALGEILFCGLVQQDPNLYQNGKIAYVKDWQVVCLTLKKNKTSTPNVQQNQHTLQ